MVGPAFCGSKKQLASHIASVSMRIYWNCKFILNHLTTLKATVDNRKAESGMEVNCHSLYSQINSAFGSFRRNVGGDPEFLNWALFNNLTM